MVTLDLVLLTGQLEAFIRPTSVSGIQRIFDLRNASATDTAPTVYMNGTALHFAVGNTSQISGGTLAINTWYHVAVARSGGTTRLFLDGTELGSSYTDGNDYGASKPVVIGSNYDTSSPTEAFAGNIDEVRIKKALHTLVTSHLQLESFSSNLYTVLFFLFMVVVMMQLQHLLTVLVEHQISIKWW